VVGVTTFARLGRHVGIASLAGLVSGFLVAGVLGRLAMRVAGFTSRPDLIGVETANGNRVGEITFAGTLALAVFIGIGFGAIGGVLYAAAEPWLRQRRWNGLIFGGALLLALGFTVIEAGNFDFVRFGSAPLNVLMFALLFVAFGASIAYLYEAIRRIVARRGAVSTAVEIVAWLAALGVIALFLLAMVSVGGIDDLGATLPVAVAVIVPPLVLWRGLPRSIAYAAFALPVIVGGVRTLTGVIQLLD
jgi:hypothetical protein